MLQRRWRDASAGPTETRCRAQAGTRDLSKSRRVSFAAGAAQPDCGADGTRVGHPGGLPPPRAPYSGAGGACAVRYGTEFAHEYGGTVHTTLPQRPTAAAALTTARGARWPRLA